MKVYTQIPDNLPPTALTIGNFDGVHLGHQALLKRLKERASYTTVLTFTNHPLEILKPEAAPPLLTPLPPKLSLLEELGIDAVIALSFTQELASLPYDLFLQPFPLTHLILGTGEAFGKNREGTPENVLRLAAQRGFIAEYIDKILMDGEPISSRHIRALIQAGDLKTASLLLGRQLKGVYV